MFSQPGQVLRCGWAQADITPPQPVLIAGQFHARVSEGVEDPLTATVWALEVGAARVVFASCDIISISNELRDAVRNRVRAAAPEFDPRLVILNATHTHSGPEVRPEKSGAGLGLPVMAAMAYVDFAAERIAEAVVRAWRERDEGRIAFGLGHAVIGRNRRWVDTAGRGTMYGNLATREFSHIEGFEDHSINLLATYDRAGKLTGLVANVPCPSQVSEQQYLLSADYWCETRQELRARFGGHLFILPQCSAAGDQSPRTLYEKRAAQRMLELYGRNERREIARRIAAAVDDVLPAIAPTAQAALVMEHRVEELALPLAELTEADVQTAQAEADKLLTQYAAELRKLETNPGSRAQPRWYVEATRCQRRARWLQGVAERYAQQRTGGTWPAEVHVVRIGEVAMVTNPFEYYLDFGAYIKANSPAVQTFLVQLAGPGTYVPSRRSVAAGGYGSIPASNPVGPAGGQLLADHVLDRLRELFPA